VGSGGVMLPNHAPLVVAEQFGTLESNRSDNFTQESSAILKGASVSIGSLVTQRRQKLMNQITMSRMNLNHPEASFAGTTCCLPESFDDRPNFLFSSSLGQGIVIGKSDGARTKDMVPSTLGFRNRAMTFPWPVGTGLASSMCQLHACDAALLVNEAHDPGQWLDVIVTPDPEVLRTDAALRENSRRLGNHQPSTAYRAAAQVHEMPVVRMSVGA
jgi:hypothetical protein